MSLSILDIIFLVILLAVTVKATIDGFVVAFFSKAAVILGIAMAVLFYRKLVIVVTRFVDTDTPLLPNVISFLIIFLVVYLIVKIIQQLVGSCFQGESMINLDHALGFFLGIAESLLIIAVILIILRLQPWFDLTSLFKESIFARFFEPVLLDSATKLPEIIQSY